MKEYTCSTYDPEEYVQQSDITFWFVGCGHKLENEDEIDAILLGLSCCFC